MIPILILQIFLFPIVANYLMNVWVDSRRTLILQDAASNMGSAIQQMYFALNHPTIPAGTTSRQFGLPPYIDGYPYTANATLQPSGAATNSSQVLKITLRLVTTKYEVTSSVFLGSIARWDSTTTFASNSTNANAYAQKFQNGTIRLGFGG
ncbi:MAG TPA: hypothetical protein VMT42_03685 [candidate division Zixibacteria bacterium]|nr:hypothetical protein [candidate division Zixibacteria bacterium]